MSLLIKKSALSQEEKELYHLASRRGCKEVELLATRLFCLAVQNNVLSNSAIYTLVKRLLEQDDQTLFHHLKVYENDFSLLWEENKIN